MFFRLSIIQILIFKGKWISSYLWWTPNTATIKITDLVKNKTVWGTKIARFQDFLVSAPMHPNYISIIFTLKPLNHPLESSNDLSWGSLQNRCDFLHISGEQRRKQGECEAQVGCKGKSTSDPPLALNSRFELAMCSLAFASVPLKYAKNYACSAGYSWGRHRSFQVPCNDNTTSLFAGYEKTVN